MLEPPRTTSSQRKQGLELQSSGEQMHKCTREVENSFLSTKKKQTGKHTQKTVVKVRQSLGRPLSEGFCWSTGTLAASSTNYS